MIIWRSLFIHVTGIKALKECEQYMNTVRYRKHTCEDRLAQFENIYLKNLLCSLKIESKNVGVRLYNPPEYHQQPCSGKGNQESDAIGYHILQNFTISLNYYREHFNCF